MGAARSEAPASMAGRRPFKLTAMGYFEAGWLPLPLPPKRKEEPPTGYTGWNSAKTVTRAQIKNWISKSPDAANIAMRPSAQQIGIDVDLYKGHAAQQWADIVEDIGELPDTWISSARADGSGIRHYALPEGYENLAWPGTVGDVIQFTHIGHRYAVLPPSRHPEPGPDGRPMYYRWYRPGEEVDGNGTLDGEYPAITQLTVLPVEIIEYFTKGRFARILPEKNLGPKSQATKKVSAWIEERDDPPCAAMLRAYEEVLEAFGVSAAHDSARDGLYRLSCLAAEGHHGLADVVSRLHEDFSGEVRREGRAGTTRGAAQAEEEWLRARDAGVKKVLAREDAGDFIGMACTCGGLDPEGKPKPIFNVANYDIVGALPQCYKALAATALTDWHGCYVEGGELVTVSKHGKTAANVDSLRYPLALVTEWLRPGGDGPPAKANPPRDVLASLIESDAMRDYLPELRGVMHTPFFARVNGKPVLINENGYHPEVKVLLRMDTEMEETVSKVDQAPSAVYVERAKHWIAEMLQDFPFVGAADKATAYAALLLPFVRDLIQGGTPLHLVEAPIAGTGKGLLTEAIAMVGCGALTSEHGFQRIAVTDDRNRNVEMVKEINARMKEDPRVLVLDNVNQRLDSGALASALTSETYQVRLLGASATVNRANRALWMATANNLKASDEMSRRTLVCRLDAGTERPAERGGFKHEDLLVWVEENRAALVWSCLTLVANWVASGCPLDHTTKMGSFEGWVALMSGLLGVNDVWGLLANREDFKSRAGDDGASLEALIHEWYAQHKGAEVKVRDLLTLPVVNEMFGEDERGVDRKLGRLLSAANGQVFGDLKLMRRPLGGSSIYWLQTKDAPKTYRPRPGARKRRS